MRVLVMSSSSLTRRSRGLGGCCDPGSAGVPIARAGIGDATAGQQPDRDLGQRRPWYLAAWSAAASGPSPVAPVTNDVP